jgi:hypothetical protein
MKIVAVLMFCGLAGCAALQRRPTVCEDCADICSPGIVASCTHVQHGWEADEVCACRALMTDDEPNP